MGSSQDCNNTGVKKGEVYEIAPYQDDKVILEKRYPDRYDPECTEYLENIKIATEEDILYAEKMDKLNSITYTVTYNFNIFGDDIKFIQEVPSLIIFKIYELKEFDKLFRKSIQETYAHILNSAGKESNYIMNGAKVSVLVAKIDHKKNSAKYKKFSFNPLNLKNILK